MRMEFMTREIPAEIIHVDKEKRVYEWRYFSDGNDSSGPYSYTASTPFEASEYDLKVGDKVIVREEVFETLTPFV